MANMINISISENDERKGTITIEYQGNKNIYQVDEIVIGQLNIAKDSPSQGKIIAVRGLVTDLQIENT